jgi:two-component system, NtrC family, sensor kinase
MEPALAEKRLADTQAKLEAMEKLLDDKSRELFSANQAIKKTNDYLQNVIDSMVSSLIVTDAQGLIQTANHATLELLGYAAEELLGQPLSKINIENDASDRFDTVSLASNDTLTREEVKYKTKSGDVVPVLFSSSAMQGADDQLEGIVCVALDLSNYKMLESQLLQSEKMASVGQLAAGVAHEINNPMGFIFSNLGTLGEYIQDITNLIETYKGLEDKIGQGELEKAKAQLVVLQAKKNEVDLDYLLDDIDDLIKESRDGADRVRKIVLNLKEFSHVGREEKMPANINDGLDSTINIVWNELKYKVTIEKKYSDLPEIPCYLQEINQVFLNLLVNAGQAIEERGEINIRTYEEEQHVCIDIADSGKGMPPEVQKRIFEPFFTTKNVGEGTGLGLSMGYQIVVDKHGGKLLVSSEEGVGTTFTMKLPKISTGN